MSRAIPVAQFHDGDFAALVGEELGCFAAHEPAADDQNPGTGLRGSGEDVLREDNRGVGAEAGHDGSSACCHDDMIGMQGADSVGVGLRVQADIDPGAGKHGGEIRAERGEHALPGRQGGNVGKTAERGGGLKQHNLVPALRGGEGGFAPAGPPPMTTTAFGASACVMG